MSAAPTVRRHRLASELRQLREAAGLTLDQAAAAADISKSALSRIENAAVGVKIPILRALLSAYGAPPEQTEQLANLAREARQRGWWQAYSDLIADEHIATYIGFQAEAVAERSFETQVIPALLQTEAYATAILGAFPHQNPEVTRTRRVELRLKRQARLNDLDYWAIVEEHALTRPTGGVQTMVAQLKHLIEICSSLPNINLQVLPHSTGAHPGIDGPFSLLELCSSDGSSLYYGYTETQLGGAWTDDANDVRRLARIFDHLRATALDTKASQDLIHQKIGTFLS